MREIFQFLDKLNWTLRTMFFASIFWLIISVIQLVFFNYSTIIILIQAVIWSLNLILIIKSTKGEK